MKTTLVLAEVALVFVLVGIWISSEAVRASKNLAVLFFYSFPSEFLVGLVPHEPVLLYFGTYHPAWVVALVAGVGTVLAEATNYRFFSLFYGTNAVRAAMDQKMVRRTVDLFSRRPFTAILVAGFTPVPFFPIRFLVVMADYPLSRYLLGVFVSRAPRFWILAAMGGLVHIPAGALLILFGVMMAVVNIPASGGLALPDAVS